MKLENKLTTFKCKEEILLIKFCPYPTSNNYLILATPTKLIILEVKTEDNNEGNYTISYIPLKEIIFERIIDLSCSPFTNFNIAPRHLRLFIACYENSVVYLSSDLKNNTEQLLVGRHNGFVNVVACNPDNGEQVVSTGDDCRINIWSVGDGLVKKEGCIWLSTPGMSISFHQLEPDKIMVAEKSGVIRFFSVSTQQAFMSIDCCRGPLSSANWSLSDPLYVAAIAGTELLLFNTSQSSQTLKSRNMHCDIGAAVSWCYTNNNLIMVMDKTKNNLQILNVKNLEKCQVLQTFDMRGCKYFDFHHRLSIVFIAVNKEIKTEFLTTN